MASEQAKVLRQQGISAAKNGDKAQARELLLQSVRLDPSNEAAWTWLLNVVSEPRERLTALYKLLEINPTSEMGLRALSAMGFTTLDQVRAQLKNPSAPPAPQTPPSGASASATAAPSVKSVSPFAEGDAAAAAPRVQQVAVFGAPMPDGARIGEAQSQADQIVQSFLDGILAPPTDFAWTQKTKRRAGDFDHLRMRVIFTTASIVTAVLVLGGAFFAVISTPEGRALVFAPTFTPSITPSVTPTNTPGATPTPSNTPELSPTPSATVAPIITPADLNNLPLEPTDVYPELFERVIADAVVLLDRGLGGTAIPTLGAEQQSASGLNFRPEAYYYGALAQLQTGETEAALRTMQEAEAQLENVRQEDQTVYRPMVDAGFAQTYLQQARQAFQRRATGEAADYLTRAEERATAAKTGDPFFAANYLTLAEVYRLREDYDQALTVLNEGLSLEQLSNNTLLIVATGRILFEQEDYDGAMYQAFLALYINPNTASAHELRIEAAIALGNPGLGVIYAQQYLFYYPGSVKGFKLLGDARFAEGNTDLAIEAYTRALGGDSSDPAYYEVLIGLGRLLDAQRRYADALGVYDQVVQLNDDPQWQVLRMRAAFNAGNFGIAEDIADDLLGTGFASDAELNLLKARVLLARARGGDRAAAAEALTLLDRAVANGLTAEQQPFAQEARARAEFRLENYDAALTAINAALDSGESGSRYLLRAQILQAQGQYADALRDYNWVLTWDSIYQYPFADEARDGIEETLEQQRAAEATEAVAEPTASR
jgi:tetratricopeptide (TPR) repeat protein